MTAYCLIGTNLIPSFLHRDYSIIIKRLPSVIYFGQFALLSFLLQLQMQKFAHKKKLQKKEIYTTSLAQAYHSRQHGVTHDTE